MIKVLHISMTKSIGGIASFQKNLFANIDRKAYSFDFVSTYKDAALVPTVENLGGRVHYLPMQKTVIPYCVALYKLIKKEKYDVVHIHKNSCANPMAIIISKLAKVPKIIVHSHNTAAIGGKHLHCFHYFFRPLVNKIADVKLACSGEAGLWMFGKKSRFMEIKNGIDTNRFVFSVKDRNEYRARLEIEDKLVVGHVGNYIPQKNHKFMIDIMSALIKKQENSVLIFVGRGDAMEEIQEYAKEKGIFNHILFLGTRNDVAELFSSMDVFLFPSLHEGLPIACVEAQASDLPCLLSDCISHQIKLNDNVYFASLDKGAEYWAEEILKVYSCNRINRKKDITACGYDAEATARAVEKIYS